jgi:D-methionine transport system ATP-binding protein
VGRSSVGIARAIANHPDVLLCDEPTSALDLETSATILELLKQINAQLGITIVLITHEMNVIKSICDRVAVMSGGKVVETGDVFDIFAHPQHAFTQQLVSRTLNLTLPDRLREHLPGQLLKILFIGDSAEQPVLSDAAINFGVAVNILHGKSSISASVRSAFWWCNLPQKTRLLSNRRWTTFVTVPLRWR